MVKRICLKCFTRWYSSSTTAETWICDTCKSEIPKTEEAPAEKEDYKAENKNIVKEVSSDMTNKTVDVICSLEGGFPIILEVIDTENVEFSIKRQEYYKNCYEEVHLFTGVNFVRED